MPVAGQVRLAWVDTETTGLEPSQGARVIEVAVVVTDMDLNPVGDPYATRIDLPDEDWDRAQPGALAVNGLSKALLRAEGAPVASEAVWRPVQKLTNGAVLAGQNVPFDEKMLLAEFARFGMKETWNNRRRHEMMFVNNQIGDKYGLARWGLHEVYEALGGPPLPPHQALADLQRCHFIYRICRKGMFREIEDHMQKLAALRAAG